MEKLELKITIPQLETAIKNLIKSIAEDLNINIGGESDLWKLCEQLSSESFLLLRRNVYFADFLRSLRISTPSPNSLLTASIKQKVGTNDPEAYQVSNEKMTSNTIKNAEQIDSSSVLIQLPELSTNLEDLKLPSRFLKLVKRLRNASLSHGHFDIGETLGDLVRLSSYEVASLPGVGASYVQTFKELKILAQRAPSLELSENLDSDKKVDLLSFDTSNMRLSLAGLDAKFTKALEKYERHIGVEDLAENLDKILEIDRGALKSLPGFGPGFIHRLIELKEIVKKEIEAIVAGQINYEELESTLIVPKHPAQIPISTLEKILLEDIDSYFEKIADEEVKIAQKRWGFVESKQTLEEIAYDFNIT